MTPVKKGKNFSMKRYLLIFVSNFIEIHRFGQSGQLKRHIEELHDLKNYICETCGHSFSQASSLRTHVKSKNFITPKK